MTQSLPYTPILFNIDSNNTSVTYTEYRFSWSGTIGYGSFALLLDFLLPPWWYDYFVNTTDIYRNLLPPIFIPLSIIAFVFTFAAAKRLCNRRVIQVAPTGIQIRSGPIPATMTREISKKEIQSMECVTYPAMFRATKHIIYLYFYNNSKEVLCSFYESKQAAELVNLMRNALESDGAMVQAV